MSNLSMWIKCPGCQQEIGLAENRKQTPVTCPNCDHEFTGSPADSSWWPRSRVTTVTLLLLVAVVVIAGRQMDSYIRNMARTQAETVFDERRAELLKQVQTKLADSTTETSDVVAEVEEPSDSGFLPGWHMGHTVLLAIIAIVILAFILGAVMF